MKHNTYYSLSKTCYGVCGWSFLMFSHAPHLTNSELQKIQVVDFLGGMKSAWQVGNWNEVYYPTQAWLGGPNFGWSKSHLVDAFTVFSWHHWAYFGYITRYKSLQKGSFFILGYLLEPIIKFLWFGIFFLEIWRIWTTFWS